MTQQAHGVYWTMWEERANMEFIMAHPLGSDEEARRRITAETQLAIDELVQKSEEDAEARKRATIRTARDIINLVHDAIEDILLDEEDDEARELLDAVDESVKLAVVGLTALAIYY